MTVRVSGQVTLPTNPNGVVFQADAHQVLGGRTWKQVQGLGLQGLETLHQESGLDAALAFSWRVGVDRKNRRTPQVLAVFVFDGPATSGHLASLEDRMRSSDIGWGTSQVERIPQNRAMSLMKQSGRLLQLWEKGPNSPVVRDLVFSDRGVLLRERAPIDCAKDDFLDGVRHVEARTPRFEDHDAELERMRMVFAEHFAKRIVEADGRIREEEVVFLDTVFPAHLMRRLGLDDAQRAHELFDEACQRLPHALGHHDKLAMIGLFFSACYSDGSLDAREMRVLKEAGETLGLTRKEVASYLERFW